MTDELNPGTPTKKSAARFVTPALALVAVLGIGIFGGVLIGQNTTTASTSQAGAAGGFPGAPGEGTGGAAAMGGFTSGEVVSIDGDTMVVENSDGEQITVTTTGDTTVTSTEDTTLDALAEGDTVTVIGDADDSGDVTASSVAEGAVTGGFGGGMGGGTPPSN